MAAKKSTPQNQENESSSPKIKILVLLAIIITVVYLGYSKFKPTEKKTTTSGGKSGQTQKIGTTNLEPTTLVKKPSSPLAKGKITYHSSFGSEYKAPRVTEITYDPLDPASGEKQTITAKISYNAPISSVKVVIYTDNDKKETPLKLIDGTDADGTWQGIFTSIDTHDYIYYIRFATTSNGTDYHWDMAVRDSPSKF